MIMSEKGVVGSIFTSVSTELCKAQFLWFASRNGHDQNSKVMADHAVNGTKTIGGLRVKINGVCWCIQYIYVYIFKVNNQTEG